MADQIGTPGSNADSSANQTKTSAPKDKSCPFCQQPFTSSSLGRHLDLYIKEKNPKPPDGIHDVEEIRKMRGGITRRQPRNSLNRREGSTPAGTPGAAGRSGRRSPPNDGGRDLISPKVRTLPMDLSEEGTKGNVKTYLNTASWQSTGVINDIPPIPRNGEYGETIGESPRRIDPRRTVSRQVLAKSTFDQKQKLTEALDNARAAELALRELLGSIKAATDRIEPDSSPFDYDPLSLDFPALTLHCLSPPPTLHQVTIVPAPNSWSVSPPDQQQYDALRTHFRDAFHNWRISLSMKSSNNPDDIHYASQLPSSHSALSSSDLQSQQAKAQELEEKVTNHLHATFGQWQLLPQAQRNEFWRLELARTIGKKDNSIATLRSSMDKIMQENAHLRQQVEHLSRCQQPREFQMMPPSTIPLNSRLAIELGELGVKGGFTGFQMSDKDEPIATLVDKSIARWRAVVQQNRGHASGMSQQRSFTQPIGSIDQPLSTPQMASRRLNPNIDERDGEMDLDADAEGEDSFDISEPPTSAALTATSTDAPLLSAGPYTNPSNHDGINGAENRGVDVRWSSTGR